MGRTKDERRAKRNSSSFISLCYRPDVGVLQIDNCLIEAIPYFQFDFPIFKAAVGAPFVMVVVVPLTAASTSNIFGHKSFSLNLRISCKPAKCRMEAASTGAFSNSSLV